MNEGYSRLAARIRADVPEIERLARRIKAGWDQACRTGDDLYLDSVALNLHSLYGGLERLFERIASTIDEKLPEGANWHRLLLEQVGCEVRGVRPAVISESVKDALDEFRAFRHVARTIYAFQLDRSKLNRLVAKASETIDPVIKELNAFADFLEQQSRNDPTAKGKS